MYMYSNDCYDQRLGLGGRSVLPPIKKTRYNKQIFLTINAKIYLLNRKSAKSLTPEKSISDLLP